MKNNKLYITLFFYQSKSYKRSGFTIIRFQCCHCQRFTNKPHLNHTNLAICHSNQSVNWKKKNIKLIIKIGEPFLFPKYWSTGQNWFARLASFHTIIINISNNIIMHQLFSSLIRNEYPWQIIANRCMLTKLFDKHFQNKPKTVTSCSNLYNYLWHLLYLF